MARATSLYRYFDADEALLYVGITSRRTGRSLQHAGEKAWWGEVARATWEHFDTREQAADAERRAIRDEQPAHNVVGRTTLRLRGDDGYYTEAVRRWPDGMDMAWDGPLGAGRWATVSWCGGISVMLWRDPDQAEEALLRIDDDACGHACDYIGDHELVDLALPESIEPWVERYRLAARIAHFERCAVCEYVYAGKAIEAATARHQVRIEAAR